MLNAKKKISNEKTTIYLDPKIKKSVRYYAVRNDKSLSEIINTQLLEYLEEQDDIATYDNAKKEYEQDSRSFLLSDVAKELGFDLDEIRDSANPKS